MKLVSRRSPNKSFSLTTEIEQVAFNTESGIITENSLKKKLEREILFLK